MIYLVLKTIHIVTVFAWIGGMLAVAVLLAAVSNTLASGVALAMLGRWFMQPWLMAKLPMVMAMLAIHGMLVGHLRRVALHSGPRLPAMSWQLACGVLVSMLFIVAAVVVKPFS